MSGQDAAGPAILLIAFNRPDHAARMMERLAVLQPARLYIAADGPRPGNAADPAACEAVRRICEGGVTWPCRLSTRFRDNNLGVRDGVVDAIDWFFETEREGIILEDDCLPDPDFPRFCAELLDRYRDDPRIAVISGTTFIPGRRSDVSYIATQAPPIWGWATWADRWRDLDLAMDGWPAFRASGGLERMVARTPAMARYWRTHFDHARARIITAWDFAWVLTNWRLGRVGLMPTRPLVQNIGFGAAATTTTLASPPAYCAPTAGIAFPLVHPPTTLPDPAVERFIWTRIYGASAFERLVHLAKTPARAARRLWRTRR